MARLYNPRSYPSDCLDMHVAHCNNKNNLTAQSFPCSHSRRHRLHKTRPNDTVDSGEHGFNSPLRDRLDCLNLSVALLSPSRQVFWQYITVGHNHFLLGLSSYIIAVALPFDAVMPDFKKEKMKAALLALLFVFPS
jgi:hypothetical protein